MLYARLIILLALSSVMPDLSPALATTIFAEAESFAVAGTGWQTQTNQRKASATSALWGAAGAGDSVATKLVSVPAAGTYRLHVRYLHARLRGPFRVEIGQGGRTVAGRDFDLEAVEGVDSGDYVWAAVDATLTAGEALITVSKYQKKNCSGSTRFVDCVLLTDDLALKPDHVPYGQQLYLRVTLGDGYETPVYVHVFADHFRDPWYQHFSLSKDGFEAGIRPKNARAYLRSGESTGWGNITRAVYQDSGALLKTSVRYNYTTLAPRFTAKFDFATAPNDDAIVKSFTRDASPCGINIVVPPDLNPENLPRLQMDLDIATATGQIADALRWPTFGKAPVLFPFFVSAHPEGGSPAVDKRVSDREWKTINYFGFSNMLKARIGGLWYLKNDCFSQPDTQKMTAMAKIQADEFTASGRAVVDIAFSMLTDEPTGQSLTHLAGCAACTDAFRQWMKALHATPQELGVATWDEVKPVDESQRDKTPALYYYAQRFRTRALGKLFRTQREILHQAYGTTAFPVNANFSDGATYTANSYSQGVDYFELLENDDQNAIWGENWANGAASPQCSTYNVELMRSAAMQRGQTVGHYLIAYAGRLPWDIQLNAVSQLGRDVKMMSTFAYGPTWAGHEGGPPWRSTTVYAHPETWFANASIVRTVGGAEDLLFSAKKRKADVAMLYASSSDIWSVSRTYAYGFDRMFTWLGLTHGHIPVDFLSEKSVAEGRLRDYKVCYFSGRNLTQKAAQQLAAWVKAGGTLVVSAGAGTHDEYNRPQEALTALLPVTWGKIDEFQQYRNSGAYLNRLDVKEQVTMAGDGTVFDVLSVKGDLQPKPGTQVLGAYADGAPAVVKGTGGKGTIYAYGFLPGLSYMRTALVARQQLAEEAGKQADKAGAAPDPAQVAGDLDLTRRSRCPWQYPAGMRNVLLAPALQAQVKLPVQCSIPLVDAVCMDSDKGLVVTLANYTLQPQKMVTLNVSTVKKVQRVEAMRGGTLTFTQNAGRVVFSLPLGEMDIVKLYY